jgi:hypothetical protein
MTDFRALCAELVQDIEEWIVAVDHCPPSSSALVQRARAALARPEPVAPTDEEIEKWADAATEVPLEEMDPEVHGWRRCFTAKEFGETIRAAIAYWGTPANNTGGTQYDG